MSIDYCGRLGDGSQVWQIEKFWKIIFLHRACTSSDCCRYGSCIPVYIDINHNWWGSKDYLCICIEVDRIEQSLTGVENSICYYRHNPISHAIRSCDKAFSVLQVLPCSRIAQLVSSMYCPMHKYIITKYCFFPLLHYLVVVDQGGHRNW